MAENGFVGAAPFLGISLASALPNAEVFCTQAHLLFTHPEHLDTYAVQHILFDSACPTSMCDFEGSHQTMLFSLVFVLRVFISNCYFYLKRRTYHSDHGYPNLRFSGAGAWGIQEFLDILSLHMRKPHFKYPFKQMLQLLKDTSKKDPSGSQLTPEQIAYLYKELRLHLTSKNLKYFKCTLPYLRQIIRTVALGSGNPILLGIGNPSAAA